jgi:hypothetical protein
VAEGAFADQILTESIGDDVDRAVVLKIKTV